MVQDFTDSPSSSTVHAPHAEVSQPTLVPVSPQTSRRYCTRSMRGSTSSCRDDSLTVIESLMTSPLAITARLPRVRNSRASVVVRPEGAVDGAGWRAAMSFGLLDRPRPHVALVALTRPERMNAMAFDVM